MIRLQSIFPNYSTTTRDFSEFFQVLIRWSWQGLKLTYFVQEEVSLFHEATKGWAEEKVWFWTKLHLFSSLECSHERLVNEISNQVLSMTVDPLAIEAWKRMELSNFSQIYKSSDFSWEVFGQKGLGRYCFQVRKALIALCGYTLSELGWTALLLSTLWLIPQIPRQD